MKLKKTRYMATIVQGNEHVDRRVYSDGRREYIKLNGTTFDLDWCYRHFDDVVIWEKEF